jgi:TBC1 domain family protein 5
MDADYPTILTHLLHYPSPSPTYPFNPALILTQAKFLRNNISPAGGSRWCYRTRSTSASRLADRTQETALTTTAWPTRIALVGPRRRGPRPHDQASPRALQRGCLSVRRRRPGQGVCGLKSASRECSPRRRPDTPQSSLPDSATAYSFLPSFAPQAPSRESSPISTIPSTTAALPPRPALQPTPSVDSLASTNHCSTPSARWPSSASQW